MTSKQIFYFFYISFTLNAVTVVICFFLGSLNIFSSVSLTHHFYFLNARADRLVQMSQYPALAGCFFKNSPLFDQDLFEILRQTGLLHLVAISGGQVRLVIDLAARAPLTAILFFARLFFKTRPVISTAQKLFYNLEGAFSWFVATCFGFSGSLQRVWFLHYVIHHNWFRHHTLKLSTRFPHLRHSTLRRLVAIFFLTIAFGNPWLNLSFLLSAMGSGIATIIGRGHNHTENWPDSFKTYFIQTAMTSLITSLVLMPLSSTSILATMIANTLCMPVVNLLLVPLALLLLFIPFPFSLSKFGIEIFDTGLMAFLEISQFLDPDIVHFNETWPTWTSTYLGVMTMVVWFIQDLRDEHLRQRIKRMVGFAQSHNA